MLEDINSQKHKGQFLEGATIYYKRGRFGGLNFCGFCSVEEYCESFSVNIYKLHNIYIMVLF